MTHLPATRYAPGVYGKTRLRRFRPAAWLSGLVLFVVVVGALGAPLLAPRMPDAIDLAGQLLPPSRAYPLGTDFFGRDMLSRLLFGARATLAIAGIAVLLSATVGSLIGLLSGMSTGWAAQAWVAAIDLLLAFPALLLALLIVATLGPGQRALALAVGIAGIPGYARLVRTIVLSLRQTPYVEAAIALGGGLPHIIWRHLAPGILAPTIALATADLGRAVLSVAALGFLGLGAPPPQAEWGLMLFEGRGYLREAPWASAVPGLAVTLTVLGVTLLGDAITRELEPRQG